jgi:hypothetical protein
MVNMETSSDKPKRKRIHKRTIVIVFTFVILPWTLISLPGESIGGGGIANVDFNHRKHGWPFTHLHSTTCQPSFFCGLDSPQNITAELSKAATKSAMNDSFNQFFRSPEQSSLLKFDSKLDRYSWTSGSFWSALENWPFWNDCSRLEICWAGLGANLLLLFLVAFAVGIPIQRKIRSGRTLRFSLFSLAVFVTLICVSLTNLVAAYNDFLKERQLVLDVALLEDETLVSAHISRSDRFPRLLTHLFNGGKTPWGDIPFFTQSRLAAVSIYFEEGFADAELEKILEVTSFEESNLEISVDEYNELVEEQLEKLCERKIVMLDILFDPDLWIAEKLEVVSEADVEVSLNLRLSNLESLKLTLCNEFSNKEQLEPFLNLPTQATVEIGPLSESGVYFILETKEQWPESCTFECTKNVPYMLRNKLQEAFPQK